MISSELKINAEKQRENGEFSDVSLTSFCEKEGETMCAFLKTTKLGKTYYNDLNTSKVMISNIY